jgi:hypothetical protein
MTGTRLNDCTPTPDEKARYKNSDSVLERAPPADVMERAHKVISDWRPDWPIAAIGDATKLIQILVRALTAYGDQRAREARASAIEEAGAALRQSLGRVLAPKIRALAVAPPQSEGGEG